MEENTAEYYLKMIQEYPEQLRHIPEGFRTTEICAIAVEKTKYAKTMALVPHAAITREFWRRVVGVPDVFANSVTLDMPYYEYACIAAVIHNPLNITNIKLTRENEDKLYSVCKTAFDYALPEELNAMLFGLTEEFLCYDFVADICHKEPHKVFHLCSRGAAPELCWAAIRHDKRYLLAVENPTEEMVIEALAEWGKQLAGTRKLSEEFYRHFGWRLEKLAPLWSPMVANFIVSFGGIRSVPEEFITADMALREVCLTPEIYGYLPEELQADRTIKLVYLSLCKREDVRQAYFPEDNRVRRVNGIDFPRGSGPQPEKNVNWSVPEDEMAEYFREELLMDD